MSGFMSKMFGKKDEAKASEKPPEKPSVTMFSGMAMKKSAKPEAVSSAYTPPTLEFSQPRAPAPVNPPEPETNSMTSKYTQESTSESLRPEDPFSEIKPSPPKPAAKRTGIPGFNDDDDEDFGFISKSKINVESLKRPAPVEPEVEKKPVEIIRKPEPPVEVIRKPEPLVEEVKVEKKEKENRILKMIEEKKKKDVEDKERKEKEEREGRMRQEMLRIREQEEIKRREVEERRRVEEEKKKMAKETDPVSFRLMVNERLAGYARSIDEKNSSQEGLKTQQKQLISDLQSMQNRVKELEVLEDKAASKEEFEEAANLHDELERINESIKSAHELIQSNSSQYSSLESEKNSLIQQEKQWIQETVSSRQEILSSLIAELARNKELAENKRREEAERLSTETSQIKSKESSLEEMKQSVNEKKEELEQRIFEKTENFQSEANKLSADLKAVQEEIVELEKQLKAKKDLALEISLGLKTAQEHLSKCLEEFEEENKETEDAEKVVLKDIEAVLVVKKRLEMEEDKSRMEYEEFIKAFDTRTEENRLFQIELDDLLGKVQMIESLQHTRSKYLQEIRGIEQSLKEKDSLLLDAQSYFTSTKEEIDLFKDHIRGQEEKLKEIDKKLPSLETDKKAAASSKQFKEASRLNNEIKELNAEYFKLKDYLQSLNSELLAKEDNLQTIEKNIAEIRLGILKEQSELEEMKEKLLKADQTSEIR